MNNKRMSYLKIFIFLITIFSFALLKQIQGSDNIPLNWMNYPGKADTIEVIQGTQGSYLNFLQLLDKLSITHEISSHKERIKLELPQGRMIFTSGSPFILYKSELMQLPIPLETMGGKILAPLIPITELLSIYYAGELYFDPERYRILASPPKHDILGMRSDKYKEEYRAVITTNKNISCKTESLGENGIRLFFTAASIDTSKFNLSVSSDKLLGAWSEELSDGAVISFKPDTSLKFSQLLTTNDPPLHIVLFTSKSNLHSYQETIERLEDSKNRWKFDTVVIDPGHGGKDPGAIGATNIYEKNVVLDVGLRLRKALMKKQINTVLTRDKDVFIPLSERGKIANKNNGKLFVSLHCNANKDRRATGMEIYFLSPTKTKGAMAVAKRENSVITYEESQEQYKDMEDENLILLTMAQSTFVRESQDIAGLMVDNVSSEMGLKNRGVDQAGFYVLFGASMPAILLELGFITNKKDEKKLKDKYFRQKLAEKIADSIIEFFERSKLDK